MRQKKGSTQWQAMWRMTERASPQAAGDFLSGWQHGDVTAMRAVAVSPPGDFDRQYRSLRSDLGVTRVQATLGKLTERGGHATARFTAALALPMGTWRYQGRLELAMEHRRWGSSGHRRPSIRTCTPVSA
jgi:hypothetical protein